MPPALTASKLPKDVASHQHEAAAASDRSHAGASTLFPKAPSVREQALRDGGGGQDWDAWLVFKDPVLERRYQVSQLRSVLRWDSCGCLLGVLHAAVLWIRICFLNGRPITHFPLDHFACCFAAIVICWQAWLRHPRYVKNRSLVMGALRVCVYGVLTRYLPMIGSANESARGFFWRMMLNSTASLPLRQGFMVRLQFRHHVLVSGVCLIITLLFGCATHCSGQATAETFAPMGRAIDVAIMRIMAWRWKVQGPAFPGHTDSSCCEVVMFVHIALGFFISSSIIYCLEIWSRLRFLARRRMSCEPTRKRLLYESVALVIWITMIATIMLWMIIRMTSAVFHNRISCPIPYR